MPALHSADQDLLHKLLLGQLSTAEVERLATEYADDGRLAELAESLAGKDDALLALLQNHETAVVDPDGERLVERLLERLKPALPVKPRDDTAAMRLADASTEPSSPDLTAPPPKLPERLEYYRPIKVLGQGGMGTVYLAEDTRLGREVAIKTLRPELAVNPQFKERFLREARSAAKLEHDHIIPIYSVGEAADGTPYLAMPLLKGEPLDALIRRTSGPLPVAMAVRLAREAASGLAAAHERGLIHRDIKPANIWLEAPTGRVKILDFGLAKAADASGDADSETHLTASGAIVGTPAYMAPEQASGHAVDGRADLFSLGCVLYELLAGKRAFSGPNTMSILMSLANHTPPAPDKLSPQCPAALSRLVMQLLEKDPANRPASAEAVIQALSELEAPTTAGGWALLPVIPNATGKSAHPPSPTLPESPTPPGSPIHVEHTQLNTSRPGESSLTLPATAVLPIRKRSIPTQRVALALAGALLIVAAVFGIIKISTPDGDYVIQTDDPDFSFSVSQSVVTLRDKKTTREYTMKVVRQDNGVFELDVTDVGADLSFKVKEFTIKRDQQVALKAHFERKQTEVVNVPPSTDPDRRAAEWTLSIGGTIGIKENGSERGINAGRDLPDGAFELTRVGLGHNPKVNDAGLAHFKDCKNLTHLDLIGIQAVDAGLANFKDCKNLTDLSLGFTQVSDAGLAHFKDCKEIKSLHLQNATRVTGAGLAHFKDCKNLSFLMLSGCAKMSDAGMADFKDCKNLGYLSLGNCDQVTDAMLARFKDCQNLTTLNLFQAPVTDAGLAHFKDCKNLEQLNLGRTKVSDAGLAHFQDCKNLTFLVLNQTQVGDAGLAYFKNCQNLDHLVLTDTQVTDTGLVHFNECKNLTNLVLNDTQVTDAGLVHFKDCKNLTTLGLSTKVTDAGLSHFKDCKNLTSLYLVQTQVTDASLERLADYPKLGLLQITKTKITEAGVKKLSAALPGCKIEWDGGVIEPSKSDKPK